MLVCMQGNSADIMGLPWSSFRLHYSDYWSSTWEYNAAGIICTIFLGVAVEAKNILDAATGEPVLRTANI
jgi:hypothetical protein